MIKNHLKKLIAAITLTCAVGLTATAASSCSVETDHPVVSITVEFNGEDHNLSYTLYRNMYPNTVRHFIELASNGFYDGMLVHHYGAGDWFSGSFEYDAETYAVATAAGAGALTEYLTEHSKEEEYMSLFNAGKLTTTVYSSYDYNDNGDQVISAEYALPTLIGEFYNNIKQVIENGARTSQYGALKMYYYDKETTGKVHVTPTSDQTIWNADYEHNCATSVFAMQTSGASGLSESDYCVFGYVDSLTDLENLVDKVADYLETLSTSTYVAQNVPVDNFVEKFSNEEADTGIEQNFTLTAEPLIIKSVKITKY